MTLGGAGVQVKGPGTRPASLVDAQLYRVGGTPAIALSDVTQQKALGSNDIVERNLGDAQTLIRRFFGDNVIVGSDNVSRGVSYDVPFMAQGIPLALKGESEVWRRVIFSHVSRPKSALLGFMNLEFTGGRLQIDVIQRIIYGGPTQIIPEHAPGRISTLGTKKKSYFLVRAGNDILMNMNLLHEPAVFEEELFMKVHHEIAEIERAITRGGYKVVRKEARILIDAIIAANPAFSDNMTETMASKRMAYQRISTTLFASLDKNMDPFGVIMNSLRMAGCTPEAGNEGYLVVPASVSAMFSETAPGKLSYYIMGLRDPDGRPLPPMLEETSAAFRLSQKHNVYVAVEHPQQSYETGSDQPTVTRSELTDRTTIGMFYDSRENFKIVNFASNGLEEMTSPLEGKDTAAFYRDYVEKWLDARSYDDVDAPIHALLAEWGVNGATKNEIITAFIDKFGFKGMLLCRPSLTLDMSSAYYAKTKNIGSLLVTYPQTAMSTSNPEEFIKMHPRVWHGAALASPNDIIRIPNVHIEGVVDGYGTKTAACVDLGGEGIPPTIYTYDESEVNPGAYELNGIDMEDDGGNILDYDLVWLVQTNNESPIFPFTMSNAVMQLGAKYLSTRNNVSYYPELIKEWAPAWDQGSVYNSVANRIIKKNKGNLDWLDTEEGCSKMWGVGTMYSMERFHR